MNKVMYRCWLLLLPALANSQDVDSNKGIQFEQNLSWPAVQMKAKATHKYIFMDVYTTWCGPCKSMDRQVFSQRQVGTDLNGEFVSVRVQMDSTAQDNPAVKSWYADARYIKQQYQITGYPTFLFFSPEGKIVHRGDGAKGIAAFLALAADAVNPARQYYTQIDNYLHGQKNYGTMVSLAKTARQVKEMDLARRIARDYINHLPNGERYTKDNLEFIATFTTHTTDPGFALFDQEADTIDRIMGKAGYAQGVAAWVIARDVLDPVIFPGGKPSAEAPNWPALTAIVTQRYGERYADRIVVDAACQWYERTDNWLELARYTLKKLERDVSWMELSAINNYVYNTVFQHRTDPQALELAVAVMQRVLQKDAKPKASHIDTYANVLYKLGRTNEAVEWEKKAIALNPQDKELPAVITKMRKGEPTWPPVAP